MSGLNGQHSGRAGMLSGVAAAIAGMTLNWASSPGNLIPPGFGLTRTGGGATYYDSTGTLQTAAADTARGTYIYNGSAWVFDGTMIEQAATNIALKNRLLGDAEWTSILTSRTQNVTGRDGVANKAWTLTDGSGVATQYLTLTTLYIVSVDTNSHAFAVWIKKTSGATSPSFGVSLQISGGVTVNENFVLNTDTGVILSQTTASRGVVTDEGAWWRVDTFITNNNTAGNIVCFFTLFPAWDTYGNGNFAATNPAATGSQVVDGVQFELNTTRCGSFIETGAASATRNADIPTAPTSGLLINAQGFTAMKFRAIAPNTGAQAVHLSTYAGGTEGIPMYRTITDRLFMYDGTNTPDIAALVETAGSIYSIATTWGGSAANGAINGVVGTPGTFDGSMGFGATIRIADNPAGGPTQPISMVLQSMRLGVQTVNNSRLANPFA